MAPALRELEAAILERELAHGDHPVLKMCAVNAVTEGSDSSVRRLSKKRSTGRIDGMVALAMALGVAPSFVRGAWVWKLHPGGATTSAATGSSLSVCRGFAAGPGQRAAPLAMAKCVLLGAGRA